MPAISPNSVVEEYLPASSSSSSSSSDPTTTSSNEAMGRDAFLKLLITQMQNQDPLNPMEGIEFTQQLAQFTSLEQLISLNEQFAAVGATLVAQNNYQAISLVGKDVKAIASYMTISEGVSSGGTYSIEEDAASVQVHIYDENNNFVRTLDLGYKNAGEYDIEWDGKDANGKTVEDGTYSFFVAATSSQGQEIDVTSTIEGRVSGVSFDDNGKAWLMVNGQEIDLGSLIEIKDHVEEPEESTA